MSAKSQLLVALADETIPSSPLSPSAPQETHSAAARRNLSPGFLAAARDYVVKNFDDAANRFIPKSSAGDPESARRARLICRFGHLGAVFGTIYAAFYLGIHHTWGAAIVALCSTGFGLAPWLMKRTGSLNLAGNLLSLILVLGFSALCCVEGGLQGHAIAWLASVPLCSMLLLGRASAGRWMIASFAACAVIALLGILGVPMRPTYDPKWEALVSAAGYLGFILFMFILGVIFETGRKRAFGKMQEALAELETSNIELGRLNQEKNEFLGIAAHDLKNPLGVIIGTAGLLRISKDEAQNDRLIGNISNAGTRMLHLVKNLLDANAIEEGRCASNIKRCEILELIRECLQQHALAANQKEIQLRLETEAKCWAMTDRDATVQILDNLMSNAVKYSPKKTTVHVEAHMEQNQCIVTVRDEGPGLSEEDLKKMFGKFTRLSARPTDGESSNGLGLSIVKRLAEAMHGTVRCESRLGEGAAFILQLPASVG